MTTPTPHGQVPDTLRLAEEISNLVCSSEAAAKTIAAAADELCRLHVENASLRAQQPAGWKLVPVEPTTDQEWAGKQAVLRGLTMAAVCKIYKAMLAAAPLPPTSAEGVEHG